MHRFKIDSINSSSSSSSSTRTTTTTIDIITAITSTSNIHRIQTFTIKTFYHQKFPSTTFVAILLTILIICDTTSSTSSTSIKLKADTNNQVHQRKIDNTTYNAIINGEIALPCNITAPSFDDGVSLVLWYRDDIATPIYTVDARQSVSLERAQHFLHTDIFDQRATFNLSYPLSYLLIKHVKPSDGGDYRCRVDFRRARTVNRILKLTVIVPTSNVIIYDQNFTIIDQIAGPFAEDSTQSLICDSNEGNPLPVVHWWKGSHLIDTEYFIVNNTISRNVLTLANLSRDDLQLSLTCQAYNTNLTVPIVKTITLDLLLKPKEIRIITPLHNISTANNGAQTLELACQCSGSKPPAQIKWKKGKDQWMDAFSQIVSNDGLTTTSFLSFVPSIDDNGKSIYCIGYNPQLAQNYSIENSWPININYAPILSLVMGSNSLSQDILEGSNVYFECDIKANPYVSTFGWKLNGQMLDASKMLDNGLDGVEMRNTSLLVTNVNHEHYGHYQCYAANKMGSSQSESVFLNVKYSPRCKQTKTIPVGVALEESITIECQVMANPTNVQFEWRMQTNKNETNGKLISFTSAGLKSMAKYRADSIDDYGYLYCQASNMVGRQDKPCVFHIIKAEAPSHPHNCSLVNKTAHSLTVECLPGYSGGLDQIFFLQVYSLNPNRLLKNLSNHEVPYFSIDDLPAGYIFKLVIYSANRKGISKSIEITGSTTEPSPWKSAEFESNDISSMTPFVLVITMIIIILILLMSILIHIRNRIKGRMRTVVQASDNKTPTTTNITPKSIMKKQHQQTNLEANNNLTSTTSSSTMMIAPNACDKQQMTTNAHHNNQTIEINDLTTTFKPDYGPRNVGSCILLEAGTSVETTNLSNTGLVGHQSIDGSSPSTTISTTQTQQPYYVPSASELLLSSLLNQNNEDSLSSIQVNESLHNHHHHHHVHHHFSPYNTITNGNSLTDLVPVDAMLQTIRTNNNNNSIINENVSKNFIFPEAPE